MRTRDHEPYLWMAIVALAIACGLLLTLAWWGLSPWGTQVDYTRFGTWSQALSGLGSLAAVTVALSSLMWQRLKTLRDSAESVTESQTRLYLWLRSQVLVDGSGVTIGRNWDLEVQNLTETPIYEWLVTFPTTEEVLSHETKRPLLPGLNVFNLPVFDNFTHGQIGEPSIVFRARDSRLWRRTSSGAIDNAEVQALRPKALP
jgi:hypothetical protein